MAAMAALASPAVLGARGAVANRRVVSARRTSSRVAATGRKGMRLHSHAPSPAHPLPTSAVGPPKLL
jgi:hypothetical protein